MVSKTGFRHIGTGRRRQLCLHLRYEEAENCQFIISMQDVTSDLHEARAVCRKPCKVWSRAQAHKDGGADRVDENKLISSKNTRKTLEFEVLASNAKKSAGSECAWI